MIPLGSNGGRSFSWGVLPSLLVDRFSYFKDPQQPTVFKQGEESPQGPPGFFTEEQGWRETPLSSRDPVPLTSWTVPFFLSNLSPKTTIPAFIVWIFSFS